jgi:hypothetical protein
MDPSQSEPLIMKSLIYIEQDLLRCDPAFVLIDSATTLTFSSQISLNRYGFVDKCIRGPKIVVHNAHG